MENKSVGKPANIYLLTVVLLMFIFPLLSVLIDYYFANTHLPLMDLTGKWFVFWAVGLRLLTAGVRQAVNPSFTAQSIFHITDKESFVVVRELGFANICLASIALISLFIPGWRIAASFAGGLFFGIAGIMHLIKKPVSSNEWIAMVSDIFIFLVMLVYIIYERASL